MMLEDDHGKFISIYAFGNLFNKCDAYSIYLNNSINKKIYSLCVATLAMTKQGSFAFSASLFFIIKRH